MRSLPSSGKDRIERCRNALVIELVKKRGGFWDAVEDVRRRWSVAVQCRVPPQPDNPIGPLHFPPNAPPRVYGLDEGWEEWTRYSYEWRREIEELYTKFIPESARLSQPDQSREWWRTFVSACVVYAPPEDGLEEYADSHRHIFLGTYDPEDTFRDDYPKHFMSAPPIVYTRRAEGIERAYETYANDLAFRVAERVAERVRKEPGADFVDAVFEVLREDDDLREPIEADRKENPTRAYIEVRPWHTDKDVKSARAMIAATQDESGRSTKPKRTLRAVQCAVLKDRLGWSYEEIAAAYDWNAGSNVVGKHITDGRRELSEQQTSLS